MRSVWSIVIKCINWFAVFGLTCFIFGVSFSLHQIFTHINCTAQTEGKISILYHALRGKDYPYFGLTYTANGIEYAIPFSGSDTIKIAGQTVTVFYNPSNPKTYYILEDKSNLKITGIAFTIGGIVFMAIGYLYAVRAGGR